MNSDNSTSSNTDSNSYDQSKNDTSMHSTITILEKEKEKSKSNSNGKIKSSFEGEELRESFDLPKKSEENENFNIDLNNHQTINFKSAIIYFSKIDLTKEKELVKQEIKQSSNKKWYKKICPCFSCNKIHPLIKSKKNLISCITKIKYDDSNSIHLKILSTIYKFCTDENECPKSGKHWEKIGFQSNTPASDLRSMGMMAPLQILYLICKYPKFSKNLYELFVKKNCEWLFAVSLINLTHINYNLLKEDKLDKHFSVDKSENEVILVFNENYVGMVSVLDKDIRDNNGELTAEYIMKSIDKIRNMADNVDSFLWNAKKLLYES